MSEIALAVIIVLVFFFSPLVLSFRALMKVKRICFLEDEIRNLKEDISKLQSGSIHLKSDVLDQSTLILEKTAGKPLEKTAEKKADQPVAINKTRDEHRESPTKPVVNVVPRSLSVKNNIKKKRNWNQERAFAFLGAFLGIIGLVFLTMYLGSIIGIFFRFMIMTGFSALLLGISFPLSKKEKWEELSHISRSFSGALFLFAVFASSTIEGLKWIENPLLSLAVIGAGTLYNLVLGGLCRKKGYMIFHMAINFLVIFLLPTEPLVFWLAFLLTLGLQVFGYLRREELNSGLSFLLFTVYSIYFKETAFDFLYFSWCFNATAIIAFINFTLFDKDSSNLKKVLSYAVPVLWIGAAAFLSDSKMEAVIPLLAGTLTGASVRIGKTRDLKKLLFWPLQILVTGILLILASGKGTQYWMVLLYIESSFFIYWIIEEQEYKSPPLLLNFLILMSSVVYIFLSDDPVINIYTMANRLLLVISASYFMLRVSENHKDKNKDFYTLLNLFQFLLPLFAVSLSFIDIESISIKSVLFFTLLSFCILIIAKKHVLKVRSLGIWSALLITLTFILSRLINGEGIKTVNSLSLIVPLLILSIIMIVYHRLKGIVWVYNPGVYVLTLLLILFCYFPFRQISSLFPGILILLSAFVYYLWWEAEEDKDFQISGTVLLLIFFVRHITHNLQFEDRIGFISIRLLIEIISLAVFYLYLKSVRWDIKLSFFQRTVFTLSWLMVIILIFSHSNRNVLSMVLQLSVVVLLYMDRKKILEGYPLVSLAYVHFLFAQANLALNSYPSFPFLPGILQNSWIFGFVNLGSAVFVIYLFFRHIKEVETLVYPVFSRMKRITETLMDKKNLTLLIPLFISLGLFFNWTLEATALTIALFSGCFILYGTALILRENVFRHTTSAALLATSVRLIFWDLAQSTMLAKSIAFLGASVIFILINILYSQFKGRFDNV